MTHLAINDATLVDDQDAFWFQEPVQAVKNRRRAKVDIVNQKPITFCQRIHEQPVSPREHACV